MDGLTRGGSILSTLWNGAKGLLGKLPGFIGKIFSNKTVQDLGAKALEGATKVATERLPGLTEQAATKIANYAEKKMKGDEPGVTEGDIEKVQAELAKRKKASRVEELLAKDEREQRLSTRASRKKAKRPTPLEEEEEIEEELEEEAPPPPRRKAGLARRGTDPAPRGRRSEPSEAPAPAPAPIRRIVAFSNGIPVYGQGKKKSKKGGAWTVKLTQG